MKLKQFIPVGKKVLIKLFSDKDVTDGGIYLPEKRSRETSRLGQIVRASEKAAEECPAMIEGMNVVCSHTMGKEFKFEGENYVLMDMKWIFAVVE